MKHAINGRDLRKALSKSIDDLRAANQRYLSCRPEQLEEKMDEYETQEEVVAVIQAVVDHFNSTVLNQDGESLSFLVKMVGVTKRQRDMLELKLGRMQAAPDLSDYSENIAELRAEIAALNSVTIKIDLPENEVVRKALGYL